MCIIIHKEKAKTRIPELIIDNAEQINPDGFGIVFLDDGELVKTTDYDKARKLMAMKRPYLAHYRFATVGKVNKDNCHPFPIPNSDNVLFSNGTVPLGSKEKTDTECVAELLEGECPEVVEKILSMTETRFAIVNRSVSQKPSVKRYGTWHKKEGVWYSKSNCFAKQTPTGYLWNGTAKSYTSKSVEDDYDEFEWDAYSSHYTYKKAEPFPAFGWNGNHKVAVYGTLKASHGNHRLLGDSEFIGSGFTNEEYKMEVMGCPMVFKDQNIKGSQIAVEIYEVNSPSAREAIDSLEGHPYTYRREIIDCIDLQGNTHSCWLYFGYSIEPSEYAQHVAEYTKETYNMQTYHIQG